MKTPNLTLSASSAADLLRQLAAIDIAVPLVTEGRTKEHREQFMMARFLSTKAHANELQFPLNLVHSDGPDFKLQFGSVEIGIECVEAVPQELYEIEIIREKDYPDSMNFGQKFVPGVKNFTQDEKRQIASGQLAGQPWMPESAKRNWIAAMKHCIEGKVKKLRKGNYSSMSTMWLLVQDEWPNTVQYYPEQQLAAAKQLAESFGLDLSKGSFELICIASSDQLLTIAGAHAGAQPIHDLWR